MATELTEDEHEELEEFLEQDEDQQGVYGGGNTYVTQTVPLAIIYEYRHKYPISCSKSGKTPKMTWDMLEPLLPEGKLIYSDSVLDAEGRTSSVVYEAKDSMFYASWSKSYGQDVDMVYVRVLSKSFALSSAYAVEVVSSFPRVPEPDEDLINVNFWSNGSHGPNNNQRKLQATDPSELELNYTAKTKQALQELLARDEQSITGRIILLHGEPGTGKSYFIRLLLRSWKKWCEGHYLVDAEQFFGVASYMTHVVFRDSGKQDGYRMIICEDADEFVSADGKTAIGQSVSRLFNLADGLVGQGTNSLVLLTTNEPIEKFHPALLRAGRSLANIQFDPLTAEESNNWLIAKGLDPDADRPTTLATLYEKLGKGRVATSKRPQKALGFGR